VVSFEVNGQEHVFYANTDYVSASVGGGRFDLSASGLIAPSVEVSLSRYDGPDTYVIGETGPGFARLVVGDLVYETTGPQADGSITISSARCSTKTMYDPVTGITGPFTTCHVSGNFAFAAVSEAGRWAVVTRGSFSAKTFRGGEAT
jgi:hypothetical protein